MDCANAEENVQKVEHTQAICSDKSKSRRTKENRKKMQKKKKNNKWEMKSSMRPTEAYSQNDRPEPSAIEY